MTSPDEIDPRFPTGRFTFDPDITPDKRRAAIATIKSTPSALRAAVSGLDEAQLNTPYREDGWTVRQVVHHVPESHINAFTRFKLALTEDNPTIRAYEEDRWAKLGDVARAPIDTSLALLDALHERWGILLEVMTDADFRRPLVHPQSGPMTLDRMLQLYAWHGPHHVAHITTLRARRGW
jgi:uncharacterized damage-inducible protein DinB